MSAPSRRLRRPPDRLAKDYQSKGIGFVAINSNDPKIAPATVSSHGEARPGQEPPYPYIFDETQEVAKSYGAKVTPQSSCWMFGQLVYRAASTTSPSRKGQVARLRGGSRRLAAGQPVKVAETKASLRRQVREEVGRALSVLAARRRVLRLAVWMSSQETLSSRRCGTRAQAERRVERGGRRSP